MRQVKQVIYRGNVIIITTVKTCPKLPQGHFPIVSGLHQTLFQTLFPSFMSLSIIGENCVSDISDRFNTGCMKKRNYTKKFCTRSKTAQSPNIFFIFFICSRMQQENTVKYIKKVIYNNHRKKLLHPATSRNYPAYETFSCVLYCLILWCVVMLGAQTCSERGQAGGYSLLM